MPPRGQVLETYNWSLVSYRGEDPIGKVATPNGKQ